MQGCGEMAMDNSPYVLESGKWTILFALDSFKKNAIL
jgi:hypothetical protein